MVPVSFEYLCSDSERKLLIGQFDLTREKSGTRKPREPSSVADGSRRNVYLLKIGAKSFRDGSKDILRVQKVIWDHLLAFKAEIIQRQDLFQFPC